MVMKNTNYPQGVDMLVVQASREYVESGNIEPVLKILNSLIEPDNIKKFADKMVFCIEGYDNDPRELAEIDKVRAWMKKLDTEWPYWFYFCSPYCLSLKFLAFVLSDVQKDSRGQIFIEGDQLAKFMLKHFAYMNIMVENGWISEEENIRVSKKIEMYFKNNTHPIIFNQ